MAIRTTEALVIACLRNANTHSKGEGDYDGETDLDQYIGIASPIIDRVNTCATAKGITLTSTELQNLETLLAAHIYAMIDQQKSNSSTLGASANFRAAGGLNLDGTTYGQLAKMSDYSGCLSAIAAQKRAGGFWMGRPPSEQTDYVDRD